MDFKENAWIAVLAVLLIGGVAFFAVSDALKAGTNGNPLPPASPSSSAGGNPSASGSPATPNSNSASGAPAAGSGSSSNIALKELQYPRAPSWSSYQGVINGPRGDTFSSEDLKGKVALVDFWTYSCINCLRTIPYVEAWEQRYGPQGLLIVDIHAPEFDFEKNRGNVEMAVKRLNLTTINVLDGEHRIWSAFGNQHWPHMYLIHADGFIRYDHIGEGSYDQTESQIRALLEEQNKSMNMTSASPISVSGANTVDFTQVGSPELYFGGSSRRAPLGNSPPVGVPGAALSYTPPSSMEANRIYLNGSWADDGEDMRLASETGDILITYHAKAVHLVADSMDNKSSVQVFLDGQPYSGPEAGSSGSIAIGPSRLYTMVLTSGYETHTARIHITGSGLRAYSFTFG
ncbi:Thiol-disulfide oxidoreductase ResA [uncultured archaeon]|nr:Thiol-disulfide oxidoreductase ResA [uncultured archaeon]